MTAVDADVVVLGAGPAGATAAREAARAGARTLLLERSTIPRYKCCGGGLVGLSAVAAGVDLRPLERDAVDRVTLTASGRWSYTRRARGRRPIFRLVFRADLDAALVADAVAAGVEVRTGVTVTGLAERDGVVTVTTRDGVVRARAVVGADGTGGRSGGYAGVRCAQVDLGLEAEVPVPPEQARRWRGRVLLDWGPIPGSYGWVFPKGDVLTAGVIGARSTGSALRTYYADFLDRLGLDRRVADHDSGHLTRVRDPGSPLRRGAVLVAGDAAGLLEPWTREGISYALRSGRLAGAAAARYATGGDPAALASYPRQVDAVLGAEMAAGRTFLAAFTRSRGAFHAALALPLTFPLFTRVVAGQTTLAAQLQRAPVRRLLAALAG